MTYKKYKIRRIINQYDMFNYYAYEGNYQFVLVNKNKHNFISFLGFCHVQRKKSSRMFDDHD